MTSTRENPQVSDEEASGRALRGQPTDEQKLLHAAASGPLSVVASDTFGWIDPEVAHRPLTRRDLRPHITHLGLVAVTLSTIGLIVSWFGPWGFAPGFIGLVLGVIALFRKSERRRWCWASIVLGAVSILFSAYWLTWILPRLAALEALAS